MRVLAVVGVGLFAAACEALGTVDPGDDPAVRTANLDLDFYVCRVQPEIVSEHRCADAEAGACHASESAYRITAVDAAYAETCSDGAMNDPPNEVIANFDASINWIFEDVEQSPLLTRPTGIRSHPIVVFDGNSAQADLIREWAGVR